MRLTGLLGIEHPIIQGPFGGGLSSVALASAVSNAGGLGSFGAHVLHPTAITGLVRDLRAATTRPFAVNLWVPHAGEGDPIDPTPHIARLAPLYRRLGVEPPALPVAPDFTEQVDALLAAAPPVISFVMGVPPRWVLDSAHDKGITVIGTATTVDEAIALERAGVDAVVASGSDAGGHRGAFLRPVEQSLVGTFSLVPQVVDAVGSPVVAAGGIADRRGVRAALALGADGVQIGTGFLATRESNAGDVHKAMLHSDAAKVTVLTRLFSGRTARGIHNGLVRELAAHEDEVPPYPVQSGLMQPLRRAAAERGLADYVSLWAGQAAPLTASRSAKDYFKELVGT
ncbi:nitronate monooxygenase [Saccharothrix tamanrassetensis]|uniref:Probable nitronate monooxygenase n=1 Tax=Saccharothrix tamanrassetensis TaxID=1051531 RepID=A0A841CVV5_9PSEU|nr:nitronate monooxygenase [Saccharothrix tamanrassetensis]MBB5960268.1 nitronate monooxygenase [Saccharothrix tamanrassetensis]